MELSQHDLQRQRTEFATSDRLRLTDALRPEDALLLRDGVHGLSFQKTLADSTGTARLSTREISQMSASDQQALAQRLHQAAARGTGFQYDGLVLGADSSPPLNNFWTFLNSDKMLSFIHELTGEKVIGADAQATRYGPGQYLTRHRDQLTDENRRIAYVLGLTERWHPDWGGLLQFYEDDGTPTQAWAPGFNVLSLFHTRHVHAVTYVTPFAAAPRLSITGWFYS